MGTIYKRKWKDKDGNLVEGDVYWIKYYRHGKPYRESSKSEKTTEAERLLKRREGEIAEGKLPGVYFDKVTFDALAKDLVTDYTVNGRDTLKRVKWSIDCLKESFEGARATDITTDKVKAHIEKRMKDGLTNASINRELAVLKRMFSLGAESTPPKVNLIPYTPMLKESNTRKGFFEVEEYLALKSALPHYLKPVVTFAYHTGWRSGEVLNLTWDKVDLKQEIVSLNPGETKSEEARTVYLDEELLKEMKALHANRHLGCPFVFHRNGEAIRSFRKAWATACKKTGLKGKLFHDFRRTKVRNMVRAGVPERVAIMVSGHKTRSVFERYNIVSDQDLKEAAKKMQTYHEKLNSAMEIEESKRGEVIPFKEAQRDEKFFDLYGHSLGTVGQEEKRILRAQTWKLLKTKRPWPDSNRRPAD